MVPLWFLPSPQPLASTGVWRQAPCWRLEGGEKADLGSVHVVVCGVLQVLGEEPQSLISMVISYSLAAGETSPETWNDREEIPGKGRLQLCLQELGGKGRLERCGVCRGSRQE